jgi:hypothetical protein
VVPAIKMSLPPRAFGRLLFRLAAALFTRKDQGPNHGIARQARVLNDWSHEIAAPLSIDGLDVTRRLLDSSDKCPLFRRCR